MTGTFCLESRTVIWNPGEELPVIHAIQSLQISPGLSLAGLGKAQMPQGAESFKTLLQNSVEQLNATQPEQGAASGQPAIGNKADSGGLLTMAPQTDLTMHVMLQIQDKLVGAYQELQNIRV